MMIRDEQSQQELLKVASQNVQDKSFLMKRSIDQKEPISNVLNHAADVLNELRTSLLSPKSYYQLCNYHLIFLIV